MKEDKIIMPKALTAENGAKALMMGEFKEVIVSYCDYCNDGFFGKTQCEECDGSGKRYKSVDVSWDTIKEIYKMAVDNLGVEL